MDEYTQKTKSWLEERFKQCDEHGIYISHQPIYGFRRGYNTASVFCEYFRTYQIMKTLSNLEFGSLLDVGGAEGYKGYVARELFSVQVRNSDISEEVCKRAEEIFGIDSDAADIHNLPYKDDEFDVVICSEVLEHVTDVRKALRELLRVASGAVVITVPHEPKKVIETTVRRNIPHGHIHNFVKESFDFLKTKGYHVFSRRLINPLLMIPCVLIQAMPAEDTVGTPNIFVKFYNLLLPLLRKLFPDKLASLLIACLIRFDEFICSILPLYHSILILILKNRRMLRKRRVKKISAYSIMNIKVPYYVLRK